MQKALAIFSGVLAAVSIMTCAAHSDPRRDQRGGAPAPSALREHGGGASGGYGGPPRAPSGPPGGYGGSPRGPSGGDYRPAPGNGYPGGYRGPAPAPPSYQENYTQQRRPNSLGSEWREQQEEARSGVRQGQMAPLGSVIAGIGRRSSGRPLDAGIEYQGSRAVYRVRWLTSNGRRVDYLVDAATGQILSEH